MNQSSVAQNQVLGPLLSAFARERLGFLTARPESVVLEDARGLHKLALSWDAAAHQAAWDSLAEPAAADATTVVRRMGTTIVCAHVPAEALTLAACVQDGLMSSLAAQCLDAAVSLGRNVLIVGPRACAWELIAALVGSGIRPALAGRTAELVPKRWAHVKSLAQARNLGPDRLAAWSIGPASIARLMGSYSGVVAWSPAVRLDQALMRFEAAIERRTPHVSTPLQVLAAIDLIVLVGRTPERIRVRGIYEIRLAEDGYRPTPLFVSGLMPAPDALVPVATPSFVDEIALLSDPVLADELRHAVPSAAQEPAPFVPEAEAEPQVERERMRPAPRVRRAAAPLVPSIVTRRTAPPPRPDAPPPGWELDQLSDDQLQEMAPAAGTSDDAAMAAAYGLAPPPRPAGVTAATPQNPGFEEALSRARLRDQQAEKDEETSSVPDDPRR